MSEYFKLGTEEGGFAFFVPDSFKATPQVLGSGVRRSINGTARQDVQAIKYHFELGFNLATEDEVLVFFKLFEDNLLNGINLTFEDDMNNKYEVMWSGNFGLEDRIADDEIYWSGTIVLEEI